MLDEYYDDDDDDTESLDTSDPTGLLDKGALVSLYRSVQNIKIFTVSALDYVIYAFYSLNKFDSFASLKLKSHVADNCFWTPKILKYHFCRHYCCNMVELRKYL